LAGIGIAYLFEPLVRAGLLRQLLPQVAIEEPGLFIYFPRRSAQVPKLGAVLDAAKDVARGLSRTASSPYR
jgi:hypothetical protein